MVNNLPPLAGPVDASGEPDFTRQFLRKLQSFDWLSSPEVILEHDDAIGFDWLVNGGTVSAHVSATGRSGWAALVGEHKSSGSFQLPDWPEAFTEALRALEAAAAAVPSSPAPPWCQICGVALAHDYCDACHTALLALPPSPSVADSPTPQRMRVLGVVYPPDPPSAPSPSVGAAQEKTTEASKGATSNG